MKAWLHRMRTQWKPKGCKMNANPKHGSKEANLTSQETVEAQYFTRANGWADDVFTATVASRNRYQMAFFAAMGLSAILSVAVMSLVPLQRIELEVVHQGMGNNAWVTLVKPGQPIALNWARTQANLAHYVRTREGYDPIFYAEQSKDVTLLSSPTVTARYELSQAKTNATAGINALGAKGYRTVVINNVMRLDSATQTHPGKGHRHHINLAQVNFVVVSHRFGDSQSVKTAYTALVSWTYQGVPNTPMKRLRDWNGFTITKYTVQPVNGDNTPS